MGLQSWGLLLIVLFGAWLGYRRGLLQSLIRLVSVVLAYIAAVFYLFPLSQFIKSQLVDSWFVAYSLSALTILVLGSWLIGLVLKLVIFLGKSLFSTVEMESKPLLVADKWLGAGLGTVVAACFGLLAVWALTLIQQAAPHIPLPKEQGLDKQLISVAQKAVVETGSLVVKAGLSHSDKKAMGANVPQRAGRDTEQRNPNDHIKARLAESFLREPQKNIQHLKALSQSESFQSFMADRQLKQIIRRRDAEALAQHAKFQRLLQQENLRAIAQNADLVNPNGELAAQPFAKASVRLLARLDQFSQNQEAQKLLAQKDFQGKLESGDLSRLVFDPRFNRLMEIFQQDLPPVEEVLAQQGADAGGFVSGDNSVLNEIKDQPPAAQKKIYRWTDENGRVHFSDKDPALKP